MLPFVSILLVVAYSCYFYMKAVAVQHSIPAMTGKSLVMALSMLSSLIIGLMLTTMMNGQLALSTLSTVGASCLVGFLIGKPFRLPAMIEAAASGIMGGMMGTMLGEMLSSSERSLMLAVLDTVYAAGVSLSLLLFEKLSVAQMGNCAKKAFVVSILIKLILPCILIGLSFLPLNGQGGRVDQEAHHHHQGMQP